MTQLFLPALFRWASLAVIGFLFACGGGGAALPSSGNSGEVSTLALSTPSATVAVGATVQLSAVPRDATGNPVTGLPSPSFATSDPARATVDANGMVTGAAPGPVTITAALSANGETLSHRITANRVATGFFRSPWLASNADVAALFAGRDDAASGKVVKTLRIDSRVRFT